MFFLSLYVSEFINLISSESNEVCNREDRKTIAPEHVLKALEVLGFAEYIEEVYAAYEQHRLETMDTMRGGKWSNVAEMTEEEALAEQQKIRVMCYGVVGLGLHQQHTLGVVIDLDLAVLVVPACQIFE
ncbi:Protein Dr1 homolog [Striga hermonthica]|uniref:Protein Dr1 homolog n=1 Tax=Striga hermonthica TaxID=68872 RepID=A0A9N7NJY1_STRHE|nr:Protein Dr1 homolog [Striga hermonthica]